MKLLVLVKDVVSMGGASMASGECASMRLAGYWQMSLYRPSFEDLRSSEAAGAREGCCIGEGRFYSEQRARERVVGCL